MDMGTDARGDRIGVTVGADSPPPIISPGWAAAVVAEIGPTANSERGAPSPSSDMSSESDGGSPRGSPPPLSPARSVGNESQASNSDESVASSVSSMVIVAPDALDGLKPSLLSLSLSSPLASSAADTGVAPSPDSPPSLPGGSSATATTAPAPAPATATATAE